MNRSEKILLLIEGKQTRPISMIAAEISRDWKRVNFAAKPYLQAMFSLNKVTDMYFLDSASEILARFLANAGTWRGEVAKRVKKEIKDMLK